MTHGKRIPDDSKRKDDIHIDIGVAAVVAVDIHDGLYVCIGDGGGGGGGVSLSPRGTRRIFRFAGKRTGNASPPFRQRPDRQRTAILLLFVSNPTQRHRHLRTGLPVLLQMETPRNGAAGHSDRLFHR